MENAKVVVIEDMESFRDIVKIRLNQAGHEVIAEAASLSVALALLDDINSGMSCDAIILDGNLNDWPTDYSDARTVYDRHHELGLTVPLIGYSVGCMGEHGVNIPEAFDTHKDNTKMLAIIADL